VDRNRVLLGHGKQVFDRAQEAIASWEMFDIGWVNLVHPMEPVIPGQNVAILARTLGLYSLSSSRVVYVIHEGEPRPRYGFAYGTLTAHVEAGEERFTIERLEDDSVWYEIYAFSRPRHPMACLAYPISRHFQRLFATHSKAAMIRATNKTRVG
jgi:uncharacterized protein (UPF0548 family)